MEHIMPPTATNMDDQDHQRPPQAPHNGDEMPPNSLLNKKPTLLTLPEELLLYIIDEFPQLPRHRRNAFSFLPQTANTFAA
jgi:hypothetical protein